MRPPTIRPSHFDPSAGEFRKKSLDRLRYLRPVNFAHNWNRCQLGQQFIDYRVRRRRLDNEPSPGRAFVGVHRQKHLPMMLDRLWNVIHDDRCVLVFKMTEYLVNAGQILSNLAIGNGESRQL